MKEKLLNNWGLKIVAFIFSFFVWFMVANIEDYTITKTISSIPVEVLNETAITGQDKVYEIERGQTVDIKVEGRRSIVENLTIEDFHATADLSQLSITNSVQINVEILNSSVRKEISVSLVDTMMKVAIEDRGEQKLPINVVTMGSPLDGYAVVSAAATPNMVTITGAASKVKEIKTVRIEADVEGLNVGYSTRGNLMFLDGEGNPVDLERIQTNIKSATYRVVIHKTKEVPIKINPSGTVAEGYRIAGEIDYEPKRVLVAGEEEALRRIKEIVIDDIDVEGATEQIETTVDLEKYLPEGITLVDYSEGVAVVIRIEKIEETELLIPYGAIFLPKSDLLSYSLVEPDGEATIVLRGLKSEIQDITVEDLAPYIQLEEYTTPGTYRVAVVWKDIEGIEIVGDLWVQVVIVKSEITEEPEPEPTTTEV